MKLNIQICSYDRFLARNSHRQKWIYMFLVKAIFYKYTSFAWRQWQEKNHHKKDYKYHRLELNSRYKIVPCDHIFSKCAEVSDKNLL